MEKAKTFFSKTSNWLKIGATITAVATGNYMGLIPIWG